MDEPLLAIHTIVSSWYGEPASTLTSDPPAANVYASNSSLMLLMMLTGREPEARACREQSLLKLMMLDGRPLSKILPMASSSTTVNTSSSSPFSSTGCWRVTVARRMSRSKHLSLVGRIWHSSNGVLPMWEVNESPFFPPW